ncbi:MAG: helix-turn-helix transcriptional regulator [Myxococcota bacterium]
MATARTPSYAAVPMLAAEMARRGLSYADLGGHLGISASAVGAYMRGRARPSLVIAVALEETLGIPVAAWTRPAPEPLPLKPRPKPLPYPGDPRPAEDDAA